MQTYRKQVMDLCEQISEKVDNMLKENKTILDNKNIFEQRKESKGKTNMNEKNKVIFFGESFDAVSLTDMAIIKKIA